MENTNELRVPKQARSRETKNKILKTALNLFCQKGFYKTTTNEIAKEANVPIGSVYSYFKNKDNILLEILDEYNEDFINNVFKIVDESENIDITNCDKKILIRNIIRALVETHKKSKALNRELQSLKKSKPEVAAIYDEHEIRVQKMLYNVLNNMKDNLKIEDIEAASLILTDYLGAISDRIVFKKNAIETNRIINSSVEFIYKYLFL